MTRRQQHGLGLRIMHAIEVGHEYLVFGIVGVPYPLDNGLRLLFGEIIANAESRSKELMGAATAYCEDAMKRTEVSIDQTLEQMKSTRTQFMSAMKEYKK